MAKSTRFGLPYRNTPIAISGYYKYQPGAKFTDKTNTVLENARDTFDIYAVMYESTTETPFLDGTNIKTHPSIVMSSSQGGAFFRGAVGSTLWVDELQLFHE